MNEKLIKINKLMQFQFIQILSDTNKDVDVWYNQINTLFFIFIIKFDN